MFKRVLMLAFVFALFLNSKSASFVFAQEQVTACSLDFNGDALVDVLDYSVIVRNYLSTTPDDSRADINKDGIVDVIDRSEFVPFFLLKCEVASPTATPDATTSPSPSPSVDPTASPSPSPSPSPSISPTPTPGTHPCDRNSPDFSRNAPNGSVIVCPDQKQPNEVSTYLNTVLNASSSGKTFFLKAGIYRINDYLRLEDNDKIIGEKGAIISGATLISESKIKRGQAGTEDAGLYYFETNKTMSTLKPNSNYRGQFCEPGKCDTSGTGFACDSAHERCNYNEELFFDDQLLVHVNAKSKLGPGKFFFDYGHKPPEDPNRVYFYDNPAGRKIELSVTHNAINFSGQKNVLLKNLIFEKFATEAQRGAVENYGDGSIVEFTEIRWNHGGGGGVGPNGVFRNNYVHHNGQKGLTGKAPMNGALYEKNEIAYNNTAGFELTWEAGGNKFSRSNDFIIRNNYSHHNIGDGFWTDIDNTGCLYEGNKVTDNSKHGIQHEISFDCVLRNNFVANNKGAQIFIQNSQGLATEGIKVQDNTVIVGSNNDWGIAVQNDRRGYSDGFKMDRIAKNVLVSGNHAYYLRTNDENNKLVAGFFGGSKDNPSYPNPFNFEFTKDTIKFVQNYYYLSNLNLKAFSWGPYWSPKTYADFQKAQPGEQTQSGQESRLKQLPTQLPTRNWDYPVGPQ